MVSVVSATNFHIFHTGLEVLNSHEHNIQQPALNQLLLTGLLTISHLLVKENSADATAALIWLGSAKLTSVLCFDGDNHFAMTLYSPFENKKCVLRIR